MADFVLVLLVLLMWTALIGVTWGLGWLVFKLAHKLAHE
jgi:hypothetical protein